MRLVAAGVAVAGVGACAVGAATYLAAWRDAVSVWTWAADALGRPVGLVESHLGGAYLADGRPDLALDHYAAAAELTPDDPYTQGPLGRLLLGVDPAQAEPHLRRALRARPDDPVLWVAPRAGPGRDARPRRSVGGVPAGAGVPPGRRRGAGGAGVGGAGTRPVRRGRRDGTKPRPDPTPVDPASEGRRTPGSAAAQLGSGGASDGGVEGLTSNRNARPAFPGAGTLRFVLMAGTLTDILGPDGAIAGRLGERYEHRPQQLEMAAAVADAFASGHHLMVEAGTGVGKSFAYLLPAIDHAVRTKKRVVISTHTISLQEQLIEKDIPLLAAVYPGEFSAVLVKGRNNYLCQRRLAQAGGRAGYLFETEPQVKSLMMIEDWAQQSLEGRGVGSLAELPQVPDPTVWDKVCAEAGNCLGKKCEFYKGCFWQAARRRMTGANVLVVNHALLFSDLALRMAGVSYLPKYDLLVLDEAHTVEDVAGQHFGLKVGEAGVRYQLRSLYDPRRGRGMLTTHGSAADDAVRDVTELHRTCDVFFGRCVDWHAANGRGAGRVREPDVVPNDLSPGLRELSLRLKAMLTGITDEAAVAELTNAATKVDTLAAATAAVVGQTIPEAVYWMDVAGRTPPRVTLHAAPVNVGDGLRKYLFEGTRSVVMTSATLCTGSASSTRPHEPEARVTNKSPGRDTGLRPVPGAPAGDELRIRQGAHLPHWTRGVAVYAITFRLADSLPQSALQDWIGERQEVVARARQQGRPLSADESKRLHQLHSERVEAYLDSGAGRCWLSDDRIAKLVADALAHFDGERYTLLAWCIMPNHVHVVVQPKDGVDLPDLLRSWKTFTAREANLALGRSGDFWQAEYYDHLIRDGEDLTHAVEYAWLNPEEAGWPDWRWRFKDEERIGQLLNPPADQGSSHGPEARVTTKPASSSDPFAYIKHRLGVPADARTLALTSPFDYARQVTLYLEAGLPEPSSPHFLPAACDRIVHYLSVTGGGAFVLFTSYAMLIDAANRLKPRVDALGLPLLVQGQGATRRALLDQFRSTPDSVLFATGAFWQGIDVQGDALRNVIIVKLPFAVPDEPVTEARLEAITAGGGNAFMQYSVPEAIIKLKQGFGRLIRSRRDTGIVAILDSRLKTKRYGRLFLDALPDCRVVEVGGSGAWPAAGGE